jgi:trans-aconitate 2-methyltransferase
MLLQMTRDWDASTYDRIADPQTRWGRAVVHRLELVGDERVLDAGCGSGRVTQLLLERLPRGHVVALDGSPSMVDEARRRLGTDGRVEYVVADLARPLPLTDPVDAILSTATFHWILDHEALFANLAAVLRPGGQLSAQCGGHGNVASVQAAARAVWSARERLPGSPPTTPEIAWNKNFATAEETKLRLERAGFVEVRAWLTSEPTPFAPGEPLETFLRTVVLGEVVEPLPAEQRAPFVKAVAALLPRPEIDYVRLNIEARRGAST